MEKFFNTAGPVNPSDHYCIDPLSRIDLEEVELLIRQKKYFVLHAPRQTGKTSTLLALRDRLNACGDYLCVYANVEAGQAMRNNVEEVVKGVCACIGSRINEQTSTHMGDEIYSEVVNCIPTSEMLTRYLMEVASRVTKPFVLFLDEIDALVGDSLVSVLRQLRAGYDKRPRSFPQSVVLCGVRDVRDYRIVLSNQDIVTGGSAFNVKAESLRLGNMTDSEIQTLYHQHTEATGQAFDDACFPMIWDATEGQPWLVNAIGYEVTMKMKENRDRSIRIIPEMVLRAIERIIYRRDTHIDILIDRLREDRVRRVIQPLLVSEEDPDDSLIPVDDLQYVIDLGLVADAKPRRIANGIYREIIPRELTWTTQSGLVQQSAWYKEADGRINMTKLLLDFQQFFRQNSDSWINRFDYREAGPQLLLQAFLQRVVNGGGYIDREYGLGRKRTDLLIRQPLSQEYGGPYQRIVLELKILRSNLEQTIQDGLRQTWEYMDLCGSVDEGHFILFDRNPSRSWEEKIWHRVMSYQGHDIMVWGM